MKWKCTVKSTKKKKRRNKVNHQTLTLFGLAFSLWEGFDICEEVTLKTWLTLSLKVAHFRGAKS